MARAKSKSNTQPKATREQPQRSNIVPRKMTFDENTLSKLVKNLDTRLGGSEAPEKRRGKKRSRDGAVLGRDSTTEEEWLKQEILALGGTDEDYDLVLEVASASDVDEVASFEDSSGSAKRDNKLLKQLSELVKDVEVPDDASESAEITESASADEGPSQKKQAAVERGLKGNQITQGQSDLVHRSIASSENFANTHSNSTSTPNRIGTMSNFLRYLNYPPRSLLCLKPSSTVYINMRPPCWRRRSNRTTIVVELLHRRSSTILWRLREPLMTRLRL